MMVTHFVRTRCVTASVLVCGASITVRWVMVTPSGGNRVRLATPGSGTLGKFSGRHQRCDGACGGSFANVISSGSACVYMFWLLSKKPDGCSSRMNILWSSTVIQLFMLPISSRTVGWSAAKRHSLSTMNLYWYVPGSRLRQTTQSLPLRRSGMRSPHALNDPVTYTECPPCDHCRTVGTTAVSRGASVAASAPPLDALLPADGTLYPVADPSALS
mmetsp:Transcript_8289/g.27374  ORF Transcript_8289/g.27374 Transcript_8289/m.27374 type:complete len:216 (-) Transcript_8289:117-764(-)